MGIILYRSLDPYKKRRQCKWIKYMFYTLCQYRVEQISSNLLFCSLICKLQWILQYIDAMGKLLPLRFKITKTMNL